MYDAALHSCTIENADKMQEDFKQQPCLIERFYGSFTYTYTCTVHTYLLLANMPLSGICVHARMHMYLR